MRRRDGTMKPIGAAVAWEAEGLCKLCHCLLFDTGESFHCCLIQGLIRF